MELENVGDLPLPKLADPMDFSWIKVKRLDDDISQPLVERFDALEKHHIKETNFLLNTIRVLARRLLDDESRADAEFRPPTTDHEAKSSTVVSHQVVESPGS